VQGNAAAAEETSASGRELSTQAVALDEQVTALHSLVTARTPRASREAVAARAMAAQRFLPS